MSSDKHEIEIEMRATLDEVVGQLEQIVAGLKQRRVALRTATESVELAPSSVVEFCLEAKQKGEKESVEFALSWRRNPQVVVGDPGND
jgi:amphi-Trp domain-containing protein